MKNRLKIHAVRGFAVAALLLAQPGCSSKSTENAATVQPSPSPSVATALTSASPTPDAASTSASNPGAVASNAAANPSATARPAAAPRAFTIRAGTQITISTANDLSTKTAKDGDLLRPVWRAPSSTATG